MADAKEAMLIQDIVLLWLLRHGREWPARRQRLRLRPLVSTGRREPTARRELGTVLALSVGVETV